VRPASYVMFPMHFLNRCPKFREMSVSDRVVFVENSNACANCLRCGHVVGECLSDSRCFVCKGKHSVFLHMESVMLNAFSANASFMPVVEVLVNGERWAKAALDTC